MHPAIVRRLILPLHERLLGRPTMKRLAELLRTQGADFDTLHTIQTTRLRALLTHADARCSAWRERIGAAGINPTQATLADLARMKPLGKDELRNALAQNGNSNHAAWTDAGVPHGLFRYTTGGSTGDPLVFYVDRARQAADQAVRARGRSWFDVRLGEREFYLWGAPVELSINDRARQWRDRLQNHKLVSAFQMSAENMDRYLIEMKQFDPAHIFAYPSSLAMLVARARERGIRLTLPSLKAVFVTGETLDPADRAAIIDFFNVPVADGYGSREAGFIAHECPAGRLHTSMETMIVELLDNDDQVIEDERSGEIVVTHLDALGMPFIRYRTGDVARWDRRPCPCGMAHQTLAGIEGRRGDAIVLPDGRRAHALSAIYPIRECARVRHFKVHQQHNFDLDVTIVPTDAFSDGDRAAILRGMRRQFDDLLNVNLTIVSDIPPEPSGKHRVVRSDAIVAPAATV